MDGVNLILKERERQKNEEGWTREHDAEHWDGEMAKAAACYVLRPFLNPVNYIDDTPVLWPWTENFWKPSPDDRIRELVKAGALLAAEIDRLQALEKNQLNASTS